MNLQSIVNGRRGMLMASGTPGSAMAYEAGTAAERQNVVRRNMSVNAAQGRTPAGDGFAVMALVSQRIAQFFDELDALAWSRQQASREIWLAKSQNLADLETRIRELDGDRGVAGRALW